jgi:hypothetical protein
LKCRTKRSKLKSMQNDEISRAEQDLVAAFFLNQRGRADTEEFAKLGEAFIADKVVPHLRRSEFYKAVAGLEEIHCRREVLFRSLYGLHSAKTKVPEFPDSKCVTSLADDFNRVASELKTLNEAMASPIWQETEENMTTVYAAVASELNVENDQQIPVSEYPEVSPWSGMAPELLQDQRWADVLAMRVDLLARIDQDRIFKKFNKQGVAPWLRVLFFSAEQHVCYREILQLLLEKATTDHLQWCVKLLKECSWRPRKDIVESYARARCSLYPTVATGGEHFELVADLLNSFENSTQDADLLGKNLEYFKDGYPFSYAQLEFSLGKEHQTARSRSGKI